MFSITPTVKAADFVDNTFVVDESGSASDEHVWLEAMVGSLDSVIAAKNAESRLSIDEYSLMNPKFNVIDGSN